MGDDKDWITYRRLVLDKLDHQSKSLQHLRDEQANMSDRLMFLESHIKLKVAFLSSGFGLVTALLVKLLG